MPRHIALIGEVPICARKLRARPEAVDTGLAVEILRGHRTLDRSVEKGTRTVYGSVVVWATRLADPATAAGATARPTARR
jgi:hypothetical protein